MKTSLIVAALLAGTMLTGQAWAQDTNTNTNAAGSLSNATGVGTAVNGPINNADTSTSGANSTSTGTGISNAVNGPINNSDSSTSGALSNSGANSHSIATGGGGGNATSNATGGNAANTNSNTNGAANAANSQETNITVRSDTVIPTTTTSRFAPQVVASGLTTSNDTCMGSTSAGLSLIGGGGTLASTWDDKACNRRQNAARLYAMGWRQESCEVMMDDPAVRAAFARSGRKCEDMAENDLQPPPPPPPVLQQLPPPPQAPAQAAPQPPQPGPGERGKNDQQQPPPALVSEQTIDSILGTDSKLR